MVKRYKNVFVSHHHKDDASINKMQSILNGRNYSIRNSSMRVKPKNQARLDNKQVSDRTIKRLLRMKMRWSGSVIVIIGKKTYQRPWVKWEIDMARKLGKPIIGVYEHGLKDKVPLPENLERNASSIVGWNSGKIISALNGESRFENPDGSVRSKRAGGNIKC